MVFDYHGVGYKNLYQQNKQTETSIPLQEIYHERLKHFLQYLQSEMELSLGPPKLNRNKKTVKLSPRAYFQLL